MSARTCQVIDLYRNPVTCSQSRRCGAVTLGMLRIEMLRVESELAASE